MPRMIRAIALVGLCGVMQCAPAPLLRFEFARGLMGTNFRIVLYARDATAAASAAHSAFDRVAALNAILSDYDPASELCRLTATAGSPVPVSDDLFTVLVEALFIAERSGGAFDVTVGPLTRLWRRAARQAELPSAARLADALRRVGWRQIELDAARRTVRLQQADMGLDLGGIAKGYALDQALAALARCGVECALVDGGGDVAVGAPPPGRAAWQVEVAAPFGDDAPGRVLHLAAVHQTVATSGDLYRFVELAGERYSHIVDPRTGLGLTSRAAVTVIGPDGARTDALASALSVLDATAGLMLIASLPGYEARIVHLENGALRELASPGFAALLLD